MGKKRGMIIKVDLKKAYDIMEWKFIVEMLADVELPRPMIDVIMHCISSGFFRILWNRETTDIVMPIRGLKQGNPISPMSASYAWSD